MKSFVLKYIALTVFFLIPVLTIYGQPLPTQHGGGSGLWVGGSAPVSGGELLMLFYGLSYGFGKFLGNHRKRKF